ncbi:MAG TPA: hypothetical protein VMV46_16785 [Thermoanaerobaculia bacterium]|nr:hypothetical protein [Thermoanaerobaculia bacterium]
MSRPAAPSLLLALALPALAAGGCVALASPEMTAMKNSIEGDLVGADFDREFGLTLGRMSLGLGKLVLNGISDEEEDLNLLRGVKRIEVGHYVAHQGGTRRDPAGDAWQALPEEPHVADAPLAFRLERLMRHRGWTAAVAARDGLSRTWVYYRSGERQDRIRGVYVIALEGEELTLVRLTGRLDRTLAAAIALSRQYAAGDDPL